jgi:peroxin-19
MLDEFAPTKPETKAAPPAPTTAPSSSKAPAPDNPLEGLSDDDFARQLQAGMAELMGELETSPEMQAQFESLLKDMGGLGDTGAAPPPPSAPKPGSSKSKGTAGEESFQETIKKTMERMQASGDQATAAATEDNGNDLLSEMMKAMQASGLDGEASEEDFSKMLLGMMEQLTNKEILYEPMKELDDKFPAWLEKHADATPADDLKRYREQQTYVREIVARFEQKTYKDENAADREYIVERMQKVCLLSSNSALFDFVLISSADASSWITTSGPRWRYGRSPGSFWGSRRGMPNTMKKAISSIYISCRTPCDALYHTDRDAKTK